MLDHPKYELSKRRGAPRYNMKSTKPRLCLTWATLVLGAWSWSGCHVAEGGGPGSLPDLSPPPIPMGTMFASAVPYGVDKAPVALVVGDFNGDGRPDIAVANSGGPTVSVLLNQGAGIFGVASNYAAGPVPESIAAADFNADGKLDLVVNSGADGVYVLLNQGGGTFPTAIKYNVGAPVSGTLAVAVGDMNTDGKPDLIATNHNVGSSQVGVLLNLGAGTFATAQLFDAGPEPYSLVVADFNGDLKPDVAVSSSLFQIRLLLNQGTGTLGPYAQVGTGGVALATADVSGDAKPDLIGTDANNSVRVLLSQGGGGFGPAKDYGSGEGDAAGIALGDFDGDGKMDLAAVHYTDVATVLLNQGGGAFGLAANYPVGTNSSAIATGDFNGDGKLDIAVISRDKNDQGPGRVSVLLNK